MVYPEPLPRESVSGQPDLPRLANYDIFASKPNDGIVSVSSQLNDLTGSQLQSVQGVVHSAGIVGIWHLGFSGPVELDPVSKVSGIQAQLIQLLNESVQGSDFKPLP